MTEALLIVVVLSLATFVVVSSALRRRRILAFAELAGVRRLPGESLEDLLARSASRFRLIAVDRARARQGDDYGN